MDPDAALQAFRDAYARYSELADRRDRIEEEGGLSALSDLNEDVADVAEEAASHAAELFEWLAKGGYAPRWGDARTE